MENQRQRQRQDEGRYREPDRQRVVMLNDDVTTMEFVVKVLEEVFFKSEAEANEIMMRVHTEGEAIVGAYTMEIAKSKVAMARRMAEKENFPLQFRIEPDR